jgi:hypothetical protein
MAEKKFDELQRELEQTLAKLKAEKDSERRRVLLREMSRLLAESDRIHGVSEFGITVVALQKPFPHGRERSTVRPF